MLARPVGFDAADRLGGGPADGSGALARQVDGDGLGGDVDGDDLSGVDAAEGDLLPGDYDDPGVAGPPLDGDRLGGRARGRPGRAGAAQRPGLVPGQRVRPGPQHQRPGTADRCLRFLGPNSCQNGHVEPEDSSQRVSEGWRRVREDGRVRPELLEAVYAEPRLRELFPWTGMGELHFSRCTETPWTWDIPYVSPAEGRGYWVLGPRRGEDVGPAPTAERAVAMVAERLPAGCGRAFLGTPEELAAHEVANP